MLANFNKNFIVFYFMLCHSEDSATSLSKNGFIRFQDFVVAGI